MSNLFIRKVLVIFGILLFLVAIAIGVSIIVLSFKFIQGTWLTLWEFILAMIGVGLGGALIGLLGLVLVYAAIDDKK